MLVDNIPIRGALQPPRRSTDLRWGERTIPRSRGQHVTGRCVVACQRALVPHESQTERQIARALGALPNAIGLIAQPFSLVAGRRRYTPDYLLLLSFVSADAMALGFQFTTAVECKRSDAPPSEFEAAHRNLAWVRRVYHCGAICLTDAHLRTLRILRGDDQHG